MLWILVKLFYFFPKEAELSGILTPVRTVGQAWLSSTKIWLHHVWESCLALRENMPKKCLSCNCALGLEELIISSGVVPFTGGYFIPRSSLESKLKLTVPFYVFCQQTLFWCIQASEWVFWWFWGNLTFYKIASCFHVLIQDQDGSHIKGLLINFIHHNWPSLLKHGFLEEFITPIVKVWVLLMRFYVLLTVQQKSW